MKIPLETKDEPLICARVALMLPVQETFNYTIPKDMIEEIQVGSRVSVPFKSRTVTGYVIGIEDLEHTPNFQLKEVIELLDDEPFFDRDMAHFFEWISDYYIQPIGKVIEWALPSGLNLTPYKTASITEEGLRAMEGITKDSKAYIALSWIRDNPGKRLPFPVKDIYPLQKKGFVIIRERSPLKVVRPHREKFVRPMPGLDRKEIETKTEGHIRAKGEKDFLDAVLNSPYTLLKEIAQRFPNGRYLVKKWSSRGVIEIFTKEVIRDPAGKIIMPSSTPLELHEQQKNALRTLKESIDKKAFAPYLLYGVTGSGKTEVYLRAAEYSISLGRKVIVLVPEIALAIYMEGIFRYRLGPRVALYHSRLSPGERLNQWRRMKRGEIDLVVGTRSALFSPLPDIGLIIVDEEHDTSYKQEGPPHYHARDMAVVRARMYNSVLVLGSGTPSVQSYQNHINGKFHMISMPERVENRSLPDMHIVDMKREEKKKGKDLILSPLLRREIAKNLVKGEQTILFLNRRGFHRIYLCRLCGQPVRCPNCDVTLTHHIENNMLKCHYCGFYTYGSSKCSNCGHTEYKPYGFGTQKLEHELKDLFPQARIQRIDTDSIRKKNEAFRILKSFSDKKTDILVGTQLISKGYDFPGVTLVGVVAADLSLCFPDFRAGERTFQIISQVAGRSGRGNKKGRVIIQTFNPDHYAINAAVSHDYETFFRHESELRKQLGYPPFSRIACIKLEGNHRERTEEAVHYLGNMMLNILKSWPEKGKKIQVLGPAESPISRIKGKYRWQILIKTESVALQRYFLCETKKLVENYLKSRGVHFVIDVDAYHMI